MTDRADFLAHLRGLAAAGRPASCTSSRHDWWVSEDAGDQERATAECRTCPALAVCAEYIATNPEPAGVYAALTPKIRNPRTTTRQETAA